MANNSLAANIQYNMQYSILIDRDNTYLFKRKHDEQKLKSLDNLGALVRERVLPTCYNLTAMFNHDVQGEILPKGCRYHLPISSTESCYVVEEPAQIRTIMVDRDLINSEIEFFKVRGKENYTEGLVQKGNCYLLNVIFPYLIFVIKARKIRLNPEAFGAGEISIFYRTKPLNHLNSMLYLPNFTNIGDYGGPCLGTGDFTSPNKSEVVQKVVDRFWTSIFNKDLPGNYQMYSKIDPHLSGFLSWHYFTKIDPKFIFDVKWKDWGSLASLLRNTNASSFSFDQLVSNMISGNDEGKATKVKVNVPSEFLKVKDDGRVRQYIFEGEEIPFKKDKSVVVTDIFQDKLILCDWKDRYLKFKITNRSLKFLGKFINEKPENFITSLNINGYELKKDDLANILIRGTNYIGKIQDFRKTRDGKIDILINGKFILSDSIEGISKFDDSEVTINGVLMKKGETYFLLAKASNGYQNHPIKFIGLEMEERRGEFRLKLDFLNERSNGELHSANNISHYDQSSLRQYPIIEAKEYPIIEKKFTYNSMKIHDLQSSRKINFHDGKFFSTTGISMNTNPMSRLTTEENKKLFFPEDENEFVAPSLLFDIRFKVGDLCCIADPTNFDEMFKIRRLRGFEIDDEGVHFNLSHGEESRTVRYVDFNRNLIYYGLIRKIVTEIGDFKAGMLIRANEARIPGFPKKDLNRIEYFIIDNNIPLVQCSNGLTLFSDDIGTKFSIVDSKRMKSITLSPRIDIEKLKIQPGDMFVNPRRDLYATDVYYNIQGKYFSNLINVNLNNKGNGNAIYISEPLKRFGIILPRMKEGDYEVNENGIVGIPSFHGYVIRAQDGYGFNLCIEKRLHL